MSYSFHIGPTRRWADSLLHLFYPKLCIGCQKTLPTSEFSCFCLHCRSGLQPTDLHQRADNIFTDRFWGRVPLRAGAAMYYFLKKTPIQRALFQLKYNNQPEVGVRIGALYGAVLAETPLFQQVDYLVPVPLHPKREQHRGYNQSTMFARGLSQTMRVPVAEQVLVRRTHTTSQTKRHRVERFENVGDVFEVTDAKLFSGKHVLLIDDVLTTGATLEACGQQLIQIPNLHLSMATIAIAMRRGVDHTT
jgi:competence protein ComFC